MSAPLSILNIHTPLSSFAIVHSPTQETLSDLYDKLSRKSNTDYYGERVGPGWLKYEYEESIWNLDDDSDYAIFAWRSHQGGDAYSLPDSQQGLQPVASSSKTVVVPAALRSTTTTTTLHLHDPKTPLPSPPEYCNPSYYVFQAQTKYAEAQSLQGMRKNSPVPSSKSKKGKVVVGLEDDSSGDDGVPKFKKQFNRFHEENGVRIVVGSIGSVHNVRMLLKPGYRHVYISRKFAIKHSFLPTDAAPGNYGYGGLINIGKWPITLVPSASHRQPKRPSLGHQRLDDAASQSQSRQQLAASRIPHTSASSAFITSSPHHAHEAATKSVRPVKHQRVPGSEGQQASSEIPKAVVMDVYLSEEPHFDVILGRSFFEKRQVKLSSVDPTDVVCLDTGEKIECELVILKDGRGEIITVT